MYAHTKAVPIVTLFQLRVRALGSVVVWTVLCEVCTYFPLLLSFSAKSFNVLFKVLPKGLMHVSLGEWTRLCSKMLVYILDSGHLLFVHLGPSCALYVRLILNMFVSGKENEFLNWPFDCHWMTCASWTNLFIYTRAPLHAVRGKSCCFSLFPLNMHWCCCASCFLSIVLCKILELLKGWKGCVGWLNNFPGAETPWNSTLLPFLRMPSVTGRKFGSQLQLFLCFVSMSGHFEVNALLQA